MELGVEKNAVCRVSLAEMLNNGWFGEDDIKIALKDCCPKPAAKKATTVKSVACTKKAKRTTKTKINAITLNRSSTLSRD